VAGPPGRKDAANGTLSLAVRNRLDTPPLAGLPTKRAADVVRWKQRLAEVVGLSGGWSGKRILGMWPHTQRIHYMPGKLTAAKEASLNTSSPGGRQGQPLTGKEQPPDRALAADDLRMAMHLLTD
jgi:hypothetical protein